MKKSDSKLAIDGILLVNKPLGLSSNAVLQRVKHLFKAKKAGHTGSLDPLATGMLPVCFGEATKISQYLLDADKSYLATGLLGIKTTTGDAEGDIISKVDNFTVSELELVDVINQFIGSVHQVPSMYSALKHQGTPLYKLAREGKTIERKAREIFIESIDLLDFNGAEFKIRVSCSKGTYIRNLVEDIGEELGVQAHVTKLHRLYTAGFDNEPMYSLDELQSMDAPDLANCLLPLEQPIHYMPVIQMSTEEVLQLRQGKSIINQEGTGCVRIQDEAGIFIGLGEIDDMGTLRPKRLLAFATN